MRLSAVLLLFKEQAFVKACVRAIYPVVDSICCATQYDRTLSGAEMKPDETISTLLKIPDPQNKIRLLVRRDASDLPGNENESRLRNAAMAQDPLADYYLIVDTDEIWPPETLRSCWQYVQKTQWTGYKSSSYIYFRKWNYRIIEPEEGNRLLVFVRRGFFFRHGRGIDLHGPNRWKEYFRKGRKPKITYLPPELKFHHGTCVGDDNRILTKIKNFSHAAEVDRTWYKRVWKNFHPGLKNFFFIPDRTHLYESIVPVPTAKLPPEIRDMKWPESWIERSLPSQKRKRITVTSR